jgi:ketosteroid isomerase-like protein
VVVADRCELARRSYEAYETGDRSVLEELLTDDFMRLVDSGDEVIVTYESTKTDGRRFRNMEVLTFDGDKICKAEVYFGWNLD